MGVSLLTGRDFTDADREGAPDTAVVNETLARSYFNGQPTGRRIRVLDRWRTIVGVVRDVRQMEWAAEPGNEVYLPFLQDENYMRSRLGTSMTLVARTRQDPPATAAAIRQLIAQIAPGVAVSDVVTMQQVVKDSLWQSRFALVVLGAFSVLATALAALGMYAVLAHLVNLRRREIGIRMALGARAAQILYLVMRHGLKSAAAGLLIGFAASAILTRGLRGMLHQISPADPATFLGITAVLTFFALLACLLPARRASRIHPSEALRQD